MTRSTDREQSPEFGTTIMGDRFTVVREGVGMMDYALTKIIFDLNAERQRANALAAARQNHPVRVADKVIEEERHRALGYTDAPAMATQVIAETPAYGDVRIVPSEPEPTTSNTMTEIDRARAAVGRAVESSQDVSMGEDMVGNNSLAEAAQSWTVPDTVDGLEAELNAARADSVSINA